MKTLIRIKTFEEIEAITTDKRSYGLSLDGGGFFNFDMKCYCGEVIAVDPINQKDDEHEYIYRHINSDTISWDFSKSMIAEEDIDWKLYPEVLV